MMLGGIGLRYGAMSYYITPKKSVVCRCQRRKVSPIKPKFKYAMVLAIAFSHISNKTFPLKKLNVYVLI